MKVRLWMLQFVLMFWSISSTAEEGVPSGESVDLLAVELTGDVTPQDLTEVLRDWRLFVEGVRDHFQQPGDPYRFCDLTLLTPDSLVSLGRLTPTQMSYLGKL